MSTPTTTSAPATQRTPHQTRAALVLLTFTAGVVDAVAFLGMGGIFTANMTGNLVLLGLVGRPGYSHSALQAAVACVFFAVGCYGAFLHRPKAPAQRILAGVWISQIIVFGIWLATHGAATGLVDLVVLAVSATSMGAQTAASRRVLAGHGVTTTFVTGTLTSLLEDIARKQHHATATRIAAIAALVAGALAGALLLHSARPVAPLIPIITVGAAMMLLTSRGSK